MLSGFYTSSLYTWHSRALRAMTAPAISKLTIFSGYCSSVVADFESNPKKHRQGFNRR